MAKAGKWAWSFATLLLLPMTGSADDNALQQRKEALEQARMGYQQSVAQHGANSSESVAAKMKLRDARKAYHQEHRTQSGLRHDRRAGPPHGS